MSKKKENESKSKETYFNLEEALSEVNKYLREGFVAFIEDKKVKTQKEFDKLLKEYGELR